MLGVLKNYFFLLRLDKPIGVYLLLWPSLSAVWLASEGNPELLIIIIFCLGSFFMRSAGVIINDYFDQDIDRKVLRTFNRPIANYSVSNKEALVLFLIVDDFVIKFAYFFKSQKFIYSFILHSINFHLSSDEKIFTNSSTLLGNLLFHGNIYGLCILSRSISFKLLAIIFWKRFLGTCLRYSLRVVRQK